MIQAATVKLSEIKANPEQPRQVFDNDKLEELATSIREIGLVQPVILRQNGGKYELIAGERRWRACKLAELETIPAIIKDITEKEVLLESFIENIQREDLTTIERENAIASLWHLKKDGTYTKQRELDGNKGAAQSKEERIKSLNTLAVWEYPSVHDLAKKIGLTVPWVYANIEAKQFRDKHPEINKVKDKEDNELIAPTTMLQVTEGLEEDARSKLITDALSGKLGSRSSQSELRASVKVLKNAPAELKEAYQEGKVDLEDAKEAVETYQKIEKKTGKKVKSEKVRQHVGEIERRKKQKKALKELEQRLDEDILSEEKEASGLVLQNDSLLLTQRIEDLTSQFLSLSLSQIRQIGEKQWKNILPKIRAVRD